jgi:hypothetical protein
MDTMDTALREVTDSSASAPVITVQTASFADVVNAGLVPTVLLIMGIGAACSAVIGCLVACGDVDCCGGCCRLDDPERVLEGHALVLKSCCAGGALIVCKSRRADCCCMHLRMPMGAAPAVVSLLLCGQVLSSSRRVCR